MVFSRLLHTNPDLLKTRFGNACESSMPKNCNRWYRRRLPAESSLPRNLIYHSRLQQLNKIIGSDALALGYFQQFNDRAFHNLRLGFYGLSNIIHCDLLFFAGSSAAVSSKPHTFANCRCSRMHLQTTVVEQIVAGTCAVNRRG